MDKEFQDIHIVCGSDDFVIRQVRLMHLINSCKFIIVKFRDEVNVKEMLIPKLRGLRVVID